jgi:hypothetical protein
MEDDKHNIKHSGSGQDPHPPGIPLELLMCGTDVSHTSSAGARAIVRSHSN